MTPNPDSVLDRLLGLHPKLIDLSLDRLLALLERLGNPHLALPPVLHVAGTNGKGSTCAFARAMAEAAGLRVHVYTSPHLIAFRERIRLAGTLVTDAALVDTLEEVARVNDGAPITVFEVITAAAFLLFARVPADLAVLEVGLGGRGDATNVIQHPAACAITSISLDHTDMLGPTLAAIAGEKAGIMKSGVPVVTGMQEAPVLAVFAADADRTGARLLRRGRDWEIQSGLYWDSSGAVTIPRLGLHGPHQWDNAGIAIAALRASGLPMPEAALATGAANAEWPARLQRLRGALAARLPPDWEIWLDGGHNEGGATILADVLARWQDRPVHLVVGMKQTKDAGAFLARLLPHATTIQAVAEPDQHLALPIADIVAASHGAATPGPDIQGALANLSGPPARVLICGSLHLAGVALRRDGAEPA
jgi:dihydrofolate synthase/folylpolyglutamate synthase